MRYGSKRQRDGLDAASPESRDTLGVCTAILGSMTQAMGAQTALGEAAIRVSVVKISSSRTQSGCAYGVEYPCTQQRNVAMILDRAGIRVREYMK